MSILLQAILEGLILGLTVCILIGPAFFALINISIKTGHRAGVAFATGIFISDFICASLSYIGALQLFSNPKNDLVVAVIGGTILIVFGIFNLFQKNPLEEKKKEETKIDASANNPNNFLIALKGFVLNFLNPFVFVFWIGVVSLTSSKYYHYSYWYVIIVLSIALLTIYGTDILKSFAAVKITQWLKPNILTWINRIAGLILIGSGISLIIRVSYAIG